jgi:hypothetical protein
MEATTKAMEATADMEEDMEATEAEPITEDTWEHTITTTLTTVMVTVDMVVTNHNHTTHLNNTTTQLPTTVLLLNTMADTADTGATASKTMENQAPNTRTTAISGVTDD